MLKNEKSTIEDRPDDILDNELHEGLRCNSCGQLIGDGQEEGQPRYCESCIEDDVVRDDEEDQYTEG